MNSVNPLEDIQLVEQILTYDKYKRLVHEKKLNPQQMEIIIGYMLFKENEGKDLTEEKKSEISSNLDKIKNMIG